MRTLEPPNRARTGLLGTVLLVLVTAVGQSFASMPMLFARPSYYAQFTDTGGLG
ncbi:MAG TPA: mammalian cell entry protein, partial [Mycobacterium sp.]